MIHLAADLAIPAFWLAVVSIAAILVCEVFHSLNVLLENWLLP